MNATDTIESLIQNNVDRVYERIRSAEIAADRTYGSVKMVAVTKYVDVSITEHVINAGCCDIGESRPQKLWEKVDALQQRKSVRWHMIGNLQKNKVNKTLPKADLIHSLDSYSLAESISKKQLPSRPRFLLEVNVSGDESKQGLLPSESEEFLESMLRLGNLEICGLMTMSSRNGSQVQRRKQFEQLRILRDQLQTKFSSDFQLHELSMGMSGDFEEAIAEGATIVRIGSMLFDGLLTS